MHRSNILLVGDSLTEQGYANQWCSMLQHHYQRRADVLCRGFSGYNTRWVLDLLKSGEGANVVVPPHITTTLFCTVFLGANDAVSEAYPQHVPLDEYESNLRTIVRILNEKARPQFGVLVITPPPIDQAVYLNYVQRERDPSATESSRTLENTRRYRDVALRVANECENCSGVDLYTAFLGTASEDPFSPGQAWSNAFYDGLHFDGVGGKVVFDAVVAALAPQCAPAALPMDAPHWSDLASN